MTRGGLDRVTGEGEAITYWGLFSIFRRLKVRSGVPRLRAHLLRHTFGQGALMKGADAGDVQNMLHHRTKAMTDRYTRTVLAAASAAKMPRYSVI